MILGMDNMITVLKGNITNKELLKEKQINAVVNAANPTLMGSNQGVDGAIHGSIIDFDEKICQELGTDILKNRKRCERGQAVTTSGYELCQYVIHTVGSKYDGIGKICSSSRIQTLESCYYAIIEEIKNHPDIRNIAIPVIGSGDYGFPFQTAVEIAVCSLNNAVLTWKQKEPELFSMVSLERIYLFIHNPSMTKTDEQFQTANRVMQEYQALLKKNRRITYQTSLQAHISNWKEIYMYDRERGYFAIARGIRELLMLVRMLFWPLMYLKDLFGGKDWEKRRGFVERMAAVKVLLPFMGLFFFKKYIQSDWQIFMLGGVILYSMLDTITYLLMLILMSDIQRPSANIIRSLLMFFVNYMEVSMDFAILYTCYEYGNIGKVVPIRNALKLGFLGFQEMAEECRLGVTVFVLSDAAVKFFFFSLLWGYLAAHMRQRRFRS